MSETDLVSTAAPRKRGLTGMVLAELRQLAGELNIPDTTGMRKGDLIAAIKERQAGAGAPAAQLSLPESATDVVFGRLPQQSHSRSCRSTLIGYMSAKR